MNKVMPALMLINVKIILPLAGGRQPWRRSLSSLYFSGYNRNMQELVFLKLGGSLITDKTKPYTPRLNVMEDLAIQIGPALRSHPNLRLIIGHGAGSFGHVPASEYRTRDGLPPEATPLAHRERDETESNYWKGFAEVWYQAERLNRYLMDAFHKAKVRAITLPPSASVIGSGGKVSVYETTPIRMALSAGIMPVIHGDVVFDEVRGGTILSTEDLFLYLAHALNPDRILLAGLEEAVWADFPSRTKKIEKISPRNFSEISAGVGKANGADVTGGMESKVTQMLELVEKSSVTSVQIFSGEQPGNLVRVLSGESLGTLITM